MSSFRLNAGSLTVQGCRENNEDRVVCDSALGLFIVADGMGGQLAGEQASQMAVDIIPKRIALRLGTDGQSSSERAVAEVIRLSVLDANQQIMELAHRRSEFQNMGTTLVLALFRGASVYIAGIGDSRAYHIRGRRIDQLTTDHSVAQYLAEQGTIPAREVKEHRFRNILWKYLGSKEVGIGPDVSVINAAVGDRFVLASDGLTGVVAESEIQSMVAGEADPRRAAETLVAKALENESRDNVSCVTVFVESAA